MLQLHHLKQTILNTWGEVAAVERRHTEYDLIRELGGQGAKPVDLLDAFAEVLHLSRGYTAAIAQDLVATLPGCGADVASHLRERFGIHPASTVFGTPVAGLPRLLLELGLDELPVRWLNDGVWVWGLETLPGRSLALPGLATWSIGTFTFHGRPDARLFLPGLDVDSDLDLRDCDLFSFSDSVGSLRLSGQIRGGSLQVVGLSLTEGPTDLSEMLALSSWHHTHILSAQGTEAELRLPRFGPKRLAFFRVTQ
jgi:hypothetical protein